MLAQPAAITSCAQEFITSYTLEQNSLVERFVRHLKKECARNVTFGSFAEACTAITHWIEWYDAERPHQTLGYRSSRQFRAPHPRLCM